VQAPVGVRGGPSVISSPIRGYPHLKRNRETESSWIKSGSSGLGRTPPPHPPNPPTQNPPKPQTPNNPPPTPSLKKQKKRVGVVGVFLCFFGLFFWLGGFFGFWGCCLVFFCLSHPTQKTPAPQKTPTPKTKKTRPPTQPPPPPNPPPPPPEPPPPPPPPPLFFWGFVLGGGVSFGWCCVFFFFFFFFLVGGPPLPHHRHEAFNTPGGLTSSLSARVVSGEARNRWRVIEDLQEKKPLDNQARLKITHPTGPSDPALGSSTSQLQCSTNFATKLRRETAIGGGPHRGWKKSRG